MGNCISGPSQPSGHYELEETRHSRRTTTAAPPQRVQVNPSSSKPHRSSENRGRAIASGSTTVTAPSQVQIKPGFVNRLERDVKLVGIKKLLGYWDTIPALKYTGYTQKSLTQEQEARGMKVMILPAAIQNDDDPCIFVYDPVLLQNYLNLPKNQNILNSSGWPIDAKSFVERVSAERASKGSDLDKLIAIAFNYHNAHEEELDIDSLK